MTGAPFVVRAQPARVCSLTRHSRWAASGSRAYPAVRAFSQAGAEVTLCDSAGELLGQLPPVEATRTWMDRFIDYVSTKREMADALRLVIAAGTNPYAQSRDLLLAAVTRLLAAGAATGTIRSDVEPADVLAGLSGVSLAAGGRDQRDQARRLLDLLMDGLRYRPQR